MLEPISIEALQGLAENATHLARIIRQWLPVTGDTETKTGSQRTAENWFYRAAYHYTACERIRNPHKLHFDRRGCYYGPSSCSPAWFELETALSEIAVAYGLQAVSDESGIPHLPFEKDVPAIDAGTLKRLELAASEILEAVRDEQAEPVGNVQTAEAQHSKIVVPTNEDVARVVNLVASGMAVQTAAKEIAKNSEHSAGSLKTMYYTWKRTANK